LDRDRVLKGNHRVRLVHLNNIIHHNSIQLEVLLVNSVVNKIMANRLLLVLLLVLVSRRILVDRSLVAHLTECHKDHRKVLLRACKGHLRVLHLDYQDFRKVLLANLSCSDILATQVYNSKVRLAQVKIQPCHTQDKVTKARQHQDLKDLHKASLDLHRKGHHSKWEWGSNSKGHRHLAHPLDLRQHQETSVDPLVVTHIRGQLPHNDQEIIVTQLLPRPLVNSNHRFFSIK